MHDHEPAQIVLDGGFTQSKSVHSLRLSLDCTENRKSLRLTFFLRVSCLVHRTCKYEYQQMLS